MMLLELLARTIGRRVVKVTALVIVAAGFVCGNGAAYASEADIWDALRSGGG